MRLLSLAEENRVLRSTGKNQVSSRSHSVVQVSLAQRRLADDGGERVLRSKLRLVDLAGSERWGSAQSLVGEHVSELASINLRSSLLLLLCCSPTYWYSACTLWGDASLLWRVEALKVRPRPRTCRSGELAVLVSVCHQGRDSKLTRLLQDGIDGSAKTLLVATVSPLSQDAEETISTLQFADRAKQVVRLKRIPCCLSFSRLWSRRLSTKRGP